MQSWQARMFEFLVRGIVRRRRWGSKRALVRRARIVFGAPAPYARLVAHGLQQAEVRAGKVRGEWLIPSDPLPGAILYIHGGGFVSCSR